MKRLTVVLFVALAAAVIAEGQAALQADKSGAAKAGPVKPAPLRWACQITFRDAPGDAIMSDGKGAYRDGVNGVLCGIDQSITGSHYQWLNVDLSAKTSTRAMTFPGQAGGVPGPAYATFSNKGSFEVKGLAAIAYDPSSPTFMDVLPFRSYVTDPKRVVGGLFRGDSNFIGSVPLSSSVFVSAQTACTWVVWFDPAALPVQSSRGERSDTQYYPRVMEWLVRQGTNDIVQGYYPMPFSATITAISGPGVNGVKPGC